MGGSIPPISSPPPTRKEMYQQCSFMGRFYLFYVNSNYRSFSTPPLPHPLTPLPVLYHPCSFNFHCVHFCANKSKNDSKITILCWKALVSLPGPLIIFGHKNTLGSTLGIFAPYNIWSACNEEQNSKLSSNLTVSQFSYMVLPGPLLGYKVSGELANPHNLTSNWLGEEGKIWFS